MSEISSLAEEREKKEKEKKEKQRREKEERRKWLVPLTALIVANVIFLSLDIRAVQAVYLLTNSWLLAGVTVLISGGLAMYWFDVLYPHAKRHDNDTQKYISVVFTILAILLSGALAFADYIVGTGQEFSQAWSNILWGSVIILTIAQGVAVAVWWSIDKHIDSEAKIEKAHAEAADQSDEMAILRTKLLGLRGVLTEIKTLNKDFGADEVRTVAGILGVVLPDVKSLPNTPASAFQKPATPVYNSQTANHVDSVEITPKNPS